MCGIWQNGEFSLGIMVREVKGCIQIWSGKWFKIDNMPYFEGEVLFGSNKIFIGQYNLFLQSGYGKI